MEGDRQQWERAHGREPPRGVGTNRQDPVMSQQTAMDARLIATYEQGRYLTHQIQQGPAASLSEAEQFRQLLDSFGQLKPPKFDRTGGYKAAEEWLESMQYKFSLCRAPETNQVELVTQYLENSARFWWKNAKGGFTGDQLRIPWNWFETIFTMRYLSAMQKEKLRLQFIKLDQQGKTVGQHNDEFMEHARYAPNVVADEYLYRRQYLNGLDPDIASQLDASGEINIQELMDRAERMERHGKRKAGWGKGRNVQQETEKSEEEAAEPASTTRERYAGSNEGVGKRFIQRTERIFKRGGM